MRPWPLEAWNTDPAWGRPSRDDWLPILHTTVSLQPLLPLSVAGWRGCQLRRYLHPNPFLAV